MPNPILCSGCSAILERGCFRDRCRACGAPLPMHDAMSVLLPGMTRLVGFGLTVDAAPLLELVREG